MLAVAIPSVRGSWHGWLQERKAMTLSIKRFIAIIALSLILAGVVAVTGSVLTMRAAARVATTWTEFEHRIAAKSDWSPSCARRWDTAE
jgi:hypothetical protein